jgi:hypothetical protein
VHMCQIDFRDQTIHDLLGDLASKRGGAEITWVSQVQELEDSSSFLLCVHSYLVIFFRIDILF